MPVNQTIGTISTAPQLGVDSKEVFVEKAEIVWGELKLRVPELNTAFSEINTTETNINTKEATVVSKEALMSPHYTAIDAVYANEANVNLVATSIASVNTTATNIANVNTVATNIANVNTVATNIADIDTVVANLTDIQNAEENAQIAVDNASICLSVTNNKGAWNQLSGALSIPASVTHNGTTWILNNNLADVTLSEPSEVNTDWTRSGIASLFDDKAPKLGAGLDLNGFSITAGSATVSQIELGYLDGVTSSIQTQLNSKQDTLVSGTNIKTVNSVSILGSGNLVITDNAKLPLSGGTMTGAVTSLRETKVAMAANNINLATGNLFTKTISGATTLTVSNVPAAGQVGYMILELTNAGSAAITWFSGVKWAGGTAPTLTASGKDIISMYTHDGGTIWNVSSIQKDVK